MKKKIIFRCLTWCPEGWDGWREQQVTNTVTVHPPLHLHSHKPTKFECEPFSVRPQNLRLKHNTLTPQILVDSFHPLHTSVSEHAVENHEGMSFRWLWNQSMPFHLKGFFKYGCRRLSLQPCRRSLSIFSQRATFKRPHLMLNIYDSMWGPQAISPGFHRYLFAL